MNTALRAPLRLRLSSKLLLSSQAAIRQLSTTTKTTGKPTNKTVVPPRRKNKPIKKNLLARRFVPEESKKFVAHDGKLLTSQQNEAFFLEHNLEPDNGTMIKLAGKDLGKIASEYSTTIAFSHRHVISPYDLRYFDPRGHPLASALRQKYADQTRSRPLWIMTTVAGGESAVVRAKAAKKLKWAITSSLAKLGYDEAVGRGQGRQIKGTLWLTIHNAVNVASLNGDVLGAAVANYLHSQCSNAIP